MIDPKDIPPRSQEPAAIAQVAYRAAPIVGGIILSFGALESIMRTMIVGVRMQKASESGNWPPDLKLSHKARERANEWIREVLPASGRQSDGDDFRERLSRVKHVRDNLAHNIEAMWIDMEGKLRILTIYENKGYEKQWAKWWDNGNIGPSPDRLCSATYSDDDLADRYDEIRECLTFVSEAHHAPGLPMPLAQLAAEQDRARRTQSDPQANPK